jgi:hypothetical protein
MVTTTHDPRSGGRPRLIVALGDTAPQHASQREFDLVPGSQSSEAGRRRTCAWRDSRHTMPRSAATSVTNTSTSI